MRRWVKAVAISVLLAATVSTSDSIDQFSFQTVAGKTVEYKAAGGSATVVNISSHW